MKRNAFKWNLYFAIFIGAVRGLLEALFLYSTYPCPHGKEAFAFLAAQSVTLYAVVIGCIAISVSLVFRSILKNKSKATYAPLIMGLIAILGIDITGWYSNTLPAFHILEKKNPNGGKEGKDVLLITIDTCRADHLGAYGYPKSYTPMLDRLASKGLVFQEVITPIPVTTSSHATIMTGLNPAHHGSRFNAVPIYSDIQTMAQIFHDVGYSTGGFVSAFPVVHEVSGLGRGFEVFDQLLGPKRFQPLLYQTTLFRLIRDVGPFRPAERPAFQTVSSVLSWWEKNPGSRWFTWVHLYDPHAPYNPPEKFRKSFSDQDKAPDTSIQAIQSINSGKKILNQQESIEFINNYDGEIAETDYQINRLMTYLMAKNRIRNTVVIVTADHGESLTEHGYYFSHGDWLYDVSIRVPMFFFDGESEMKPAIKQRQIATTDIMPTILSYLGVRGEEKTFDGYDLSFALKGTKSLPAHPVFCETASGVYIKAHQPQDSRIRRKKRCVRTETDKLVLLDDGTQIYYDLVSDPRENSGTTEHQGEIQMRLLSMMTRYIKTVDPPNRRPPDLPDIEYLKELQALGYIR